jgi:hypothetical protein
MRSVTGIELGADSCVLTRVRPGPDAIRLSAVSGTAASDWDDAQPLAGNLRRVRRAGGFPRRANVVAWGLHESASASDPLTRATLAPLRDAGFAVDAVLSPAEALCLLAARRAKAAGREGEAWLALNRHGVAIAIVDGGRLLYRREFDWHYRDAATPREDLLQRYSLVAHLAPEVRHGIDVVGAEHGVAVNAIVTCGDLPDLRSLTMPLIEELDIEVETLDTLEGLRVEGAAAVDTAVEAPALRLACAAGAARTAAGMKDPLRLMAAAALLIAVLIGAWLLARFFAASRPTGATQTVSRGSTAASAATPVPTSGTPAAPHPIAPSVGGAAARSGPADQRTSGPADERTSAPRETVRPSPERSVPAATSGRQDAGRGSSRPTDAARPARNPEREAANATPVPSRTPLRAPLPVVNSILVAPERRLAVVNGEIVREGDRVGPRILVRIEPTALVLREPSGYEVRVPIRRKVS